jgi:hypothetical protein
MGFLPHLHEASPINVKIAGFVELNELIILTYFDSTKYLGIYVSQNATFHGFYGVKLQNGFFIIFSKRLFFARFCSRSFLIRLLLFSFNRSIRRSIISNYEMN